VSATGAFVVFGTIGDERVYGLRLFLSKELVWSAPLRSSGTTSLFQTIFRTVPVQKCRDYPWSLDYP